MAARGQLIIKLRVDGTIQAETKNIHGDACVPFAAILEDLCDAEAIDSDYTPDFYATTDAHDRSLKDELRDNA
jgi:hypothetical protein